MTFCQKSCSRWSCQWQRRDDIYLCNGGRRPKVRVLMYTPCVCWVLLIKQWRGIHRNTHVLSWQGRFSDPLNRPGHLGRAVSGATQSLGHNPHGVLMIEQYSFTNCWKKATNVQSVKKGNQYFNSANYVHMGIVMVKNLDSKVFGKQWHKLSALVLRNNQSGQPSYVRLLCHTG